MPVRLARNVQAVRIRELRGVTVGRADAKSQRSPGRYFHAAHLRSDGGAAVPQLIRTFEAQELLDGALDQIRIARQRAALVRPLHQKLQAVADEIGRGLVTRIQYENTVVQQLAFRQLQSILILSEEAS